MANACKRDIGHETSHENWELDTLPNCIDTISLFMFSPKGNDVGMVGANVAVEGIDCVDCDDCDVCVLGDITMSSLWLHTTSWKFLTLAWVTRPWKLSTYDCVSVI
jgi:hypothetical protein